MKKTLLIINSMAGNGHIADYTYDFISHLSSSDNMVTVFPIEPENGLDLSEFLKSERFDTVIGVGGDGTFSRTINEVMNLDYSPVVGYIPAGTTNDFSRNLGLVTDLDEACDIIRQRNTVSYDLGLFNDSYFAYVASFGAVSSVSYSTDQASKNILGFSAYIFNGLSLLPEILSAKCHLKIEVDDEIIEGDYLFGAIANSLSVAGFRINTLSTKDLIDGEFELFLVRRPEHFQDIPGIAVSILNNDFTNPYIEYRHITSARITTDTNTQWTLDGEYGGNPTEIEFRAVHSAINIITNRSM